VSFILFLAFVLPSQISQIANLSVDQVRWILGSGLSVFIFLGFVGEYQRRQNRIKVRAVLLGPEITLDALKRELEVLATEPPATFFMSGYTRPDPVKIKEMADRLNLLTADTKRYLVNLNEDEFQVDSQLVQTMQSPSGHISLLAAKLLAQIVGWESQNTISEPERAKLRQQARDIEDAILSPEKLKVAVEGASEHKLSEEETRLRKEFPQTWLAIDKAPESIRKRGMVKLYLAECRSILSIETLGRHHPIFSSQSVQLQFEKDKMSMDRLIAQILFARYHPVHWWDNFG